jgi:tetratricopeptide (TPR) repeat protein
MALKLIAIVSLIGCAHAASTVPVSGTAPLSERIGRDRDQLEAPATRAQAERDLADVAGELAALEKKQPGDAKLHYLRSKALRYLEKLPEARDELNTAVRLAPGDTRAADDLGSVLLKLKQPEAAAELLRRAVTLPGAGVYTWFFLGNAQQELGQRDAALESYEQALKLEPDAENAHFNAGLLRQLKGDVAGSRPHFEALVRLDPEDAIGHAKLMQTYQSLGLWSLRDQEREKLLALHKQGKTKGVDFGREQFAVGDKWIFASEYYEPKPPWNVRYEFAVLPNAYTSKSLFTVQLESDDGDQEIAHANGLPAGLRLYTVDGTWPGAHATYAFFHGEPTYEEVRALAVKVVEGTAKSVSSTTVKPAK